MQKTFITCAVTGAGDGHKRNRDVPISPDEIAASALAATGAGAAIVHIHVRDPETGEGCRDDALYAQVVDRIRDKDESVIINLTGGMGGDAVFGSDNPLPLRDGSDLVGQHERLSHVKNCAPISAPWIVDLTMWGRETWSISVRPTISGLGLKAFGIWASSPNWKSSTLATCDSR